MDDEVINLNDNNLFETDDKARVEEVQQEQAEKEMKEIQKTQKQKPRNDKVFGEDTENLDDFEYNLLKRKRITKIRRWYKTFPKKLGKAPSLQTLDKYDLQKLDYILKDCQYTVGCSNANSSMLTMAKGGIQALESGGNMLLGLQLDGLADTLNNNEDFQDNLKELLLYYDEQVYTRPEWRIIQTIFITGTTIHTKNKMMNKPIKPKKVDPNILNDYKDL